MFRLIPHAMVLLSSMPILAAPATPPSSSEPGVAEAAKSPTRVVEKLEFTHPDREFRGIWFASNNLFEGREKIAQHMDLLKSCNFNAVMVDAWFRGYVSYKSDLIPLHPDLKEDLFAWSVEQAHARGLQAHAWISYGFYAYHTKDATSDKSMGPLLDKHPELVAVRADGTKYLHNDKLGDFYSLCPANPKSHELLGELMVETVKRYPVDGVHLDRIRFPEADYCHCDYCETVFKADTGIELKVFEKGSTEQRAWTDWKRQQTLAAVRHFRKVVQAAKPGIMMTSYVLNPDEMDSRAQSWDLWMKEDLLDYVAVSMYGAEISDYSARALQLLGGKEKLLNALACDKGPEIFTNNIQVARNIGSAGQVTWWMGDLPKNADALRQGPYRLPASIDPK